MVTPNLKDLCNGCAPVFGANRIISPNCKKSCRAVAAAGQSGVIDLPSWAEHRIRFYEDNRYQILDPYTVLPNDPWYGFVTT